MTKQLRQDEIDKIPEDGVDYKDFILQVASNNNWEFDWTDYSAAIAKSPKASLSRVSTTLKELEDDRFVIKQSGRRIYMVTTKGIRYYKERESKIASGIEDKTETKINDNINDSNNPIIEAPIEEYDYNTIKLNRTSDNIDAVNNNVSRTSFWIAIASGVSALAVVSQVIVSILGTTTVDGTIHISPQQTEIEQLKKQLKETTAAKDHLSFELDSLKMEHQKLTKK